MSIRLRDALMGRLEAMRYEPTAKRIRATLGGATVVDSVRTVLVWEPRRVVPSYAVPEEDLLADLASAVPVEGIDIEADGHEMPDVSALRVLDPSIPFAAHSAEGQPVDVLANGQRLPGAGFRLEEDDLSGYVVLDFPAFDQWFEEDEPNVGHPRDPFHRIDVVTSSRSVRIELDGELLAESARPTLLFETMLPTRFYLPREDVRVELAASETESWCAYKGRASYWSATLGDHGVADIAWSYPAPQHEAEHVRDLVSFFDERVDLVLDGERRERPRTPWTPRGR
jgi:uncharacterized protein (DUF427 family)